MNYHLLPHKALPNFNVALKFVDVERHKKLFRLPDTEELQLEYMFDFPARKSWNRAALRPIFNLGIYRTDAVVDYIKVGFVREGHFNWAKLSDSLHDELGEKISVTPIKKRHLDGKSNFQARMQTPDPERLHDLIDVLNRHEHIECSGQVTEIEVSLDWYAHSHKDKDRWLMTELIWRHFLPDLGLWDADKGYPRSIWGNEDDRKKDKGKRQGSPFLAKPSMKEGELDSEEYSNVQIDFDSARNRNLDINKHIQPNLNGTIYFGERDSEVEYKIMHKALDEQNRNEKKAKRLFKKAKRTRIEVTIRGKEMRKAQLEKVETLSEGLKRIRTNYFNFYLPTVEYYGKSSKSLRGIVAAVLAPKRAEFFVRTGVFGSFIAEKAHRDRLVAHNLRAKKQGSEKHKVFRQGKTKVLKRGETKALRKEDAKTGWLVAYPELNERAGKAFDRLSKEWMES